MPTFDEVAELVREQTNYDGPLTDDTELQADLGVAGDDLDRLLLAWAERFGADLSGYLPHFHTAEEGFNLGAWFYPPRDSRLPDVPITVGMLHQYAELGRWALEYPDHDPRRRRPDVWVNRVVATAVAGGLLAGVVRGCVS
ncbi:DUF1493 family protein [Urbifossiella limnaea]|uniref:DUF1493 family protein n=1 Tax=Urbifossiella limnaea TaxID=2528023 RepID=A0A517Y0T2_9BACT|nr:DUF1493 family protein [Urbifossiella limnaea]QDU23365.1 hypothetical protein ETAA1_53640 [Urbifossiella limnaea]